MVRKRRTDVPGGAESSESHETGGGRGGVQHPSQQQQQGGGRGSGPQRGGYGGRGGGGAPRGGMAPQQSYGGPPEYYQQGRGTQQYQQGGGQPQRRGGIGGRGAPSGGPSRPPVPELHQATETPHQPVPHGRPSETYAEAGSSSSQPPEPMTHQVTQQFQQLAVQPEAAATQAIPPSSSKSMRFPLRPGKGSNGTRCIVKANHFFAELPDKDLHQYDVSINPEVASRGVNRAVMEQLVKLYRESHLGKRLPAYDGRKSLYTAGPLPFVQKDFKITLIDDDDGPGGARREREFKVVIKLAARAFHCRITSDQF